jgi:hypothetical protein
VGRRSRVADAGHCGRGELLRSPPGCGGSLRGRRSRVVAAGTAVAGSLRSPQAPPGRSAVAVESQRGRRGSGSPRVAAVATGLRLPPGRCGEHGLVGVVEQPVLGVLRLEVQRRWVAAVAASPRGRCRVVVVAAGAAGLLRSPRRCGRRPRSSRFAASATQAPPDRYAVVSVAAESLRGRRSLRFAAGSPPVRCGHRVVASLRSSRRCGRWVAAVAGLLRFAASLRSPPGRCGSPPAPPGRCGHRVVASLRSSRLPPGRYGSPQAPRRHRRVATRSPRSRSAVAAVGGRRRSVRSPPGCCGCRGSVRLPPGCCGSP